MANNIALFQKFIDRLDEVYRLEAKTSVLDGDNTLTRMGANANEIHVPKMETSGLSDYSRINGYEKGSVTLEFETKKFNYDRGKKFSVDAMDNEETVGLAFGMLASEFTRNHSVPELDAFRFAKYASYTGVTTVEGDITEVDESLKALRTAQTTFDNLEIPASQRILFATFDMINEIQNADTNKSKAVLASFSQIIGVPPSRFHTAVTLNNGEDGGFTPGGSEINFMVIHKPAVMQYTKHRVNKIITPEANQESDGWLFFYRSYGLSEVYDNKVKGIYVHTKAGA